MHAKTWFGAERYICRPVWVLSGVLALLKKLLPALRPDELAHTTCLICFFLSSLGAEGFPPEARLPEAAHQLLILDAAEVKFCPLIERGMKRRRRKAPARKSLSGSLLRIAASGKLAYVVRKQKRVEGVRVAAALDIFPWFALGSQATGTVLAWHASRAHHRQRLLCPSDSPCERMGSTLRQQWEQRGGQVSARQVIDKLMLAQTGRKFAGDVRDVIIVDEVAHMMRSTAKYKPGGIREVSAAPSSSETQSMLLVANVGAFRNVEVEAWLGRRNVSEKLGSLLLRLVAYSQSVTRRISSAGASVFVTQGPEPQRLGAPCAPQMHVCPQTVFFFLPALGGRVGSRRTSQAKAWRKDRRI